MDYDCKNSDIKTGGSAGARALFDVKADWVKEG